MAKVEFDFSQLSEQLQKALRDMGFEKPTPIQREVIPLALKGYDILGQAPTGTGKTASFGIPIVERSGKEEDIIALIMTPTRELALQVKEHLTGLAKYKGLRVYSFYGGVPVGKDVQVLQKTVPNVVVGTPGRIKDLISRGVLRLEKVRYFVLDEVDRMLDMGFIEDVEYIIGQLPEDRQTFFFSATLPEEVRVLAEKHLKRDYKLVRVYTEELKPRIEEKLVKLASSEEKLPALERILREHSQDRIIVFVKTRKDAKEIAQELKRKNFQVAPLHGDMMQKQREKVLNLFKRGNVKVLVATDVASRGLDIRDVGLVINYHLPENPEVYVHRIGRTGRIGNAGKAYSLVSPEERSILRKIWTSKRGQ